MKKLITSVCLILWAHILSPVMAAPQQSQTPPIKPRYRRPSGVDLTGYNPTTGELNMVVHLIRLETYGKLTVQLSPWNGTQIQGDTLLREDVTGRSELSFVIELTIPGNDTSGIIVTVSDTSEVTEVGLDKFGVMEFQRFFITTGDSLEVSAHPPWEKRSMIDKSKCDISRQEPIEVSLMGWLPPDGSGEVSLAFAAWVGDAFRWEPIHVRLQPGHGVTVKGKWLWAHQKPTPRRKRTDPWPVPNDSAGTFTWTDRQPNPGNRFGIIGLSLAPNDTCYATLTTSCQNEVAKIDMKFVTTGDTTECWWAGPGEDFHPILHWQSLYFEHVSPEDFVKRHFDGYASAIDRGCLPGYGRPFVGSFDFIALPAPNQVAEAVFTLEATDIYIQPGAGGDWEIVPTIWGFENQVKVVGDSVFLWRGPHSPGDTFTDTLRFVPLASGGSTITLQMKGWVRESGLPIRWFFDNHGKLLYLGNPEKTGSALRNLKTVGTVFIESDSLHLRQYAGKKGLDFFDCETAIKPLPRIGDTTYIHYRLTANRDWDTGLDYSITPRHIEIISYPDPLDFAFKKGDTIELKVGIVPIPAPGPHSVRLQIFSELGIRPGKPPHPEDIWCGFVFDDDGKIRYANIYGYHYSILNFPASELPNIQVVPGKYTAEEIVVYKSGEVYQGKRLVKPAGKP